MSSSQTPRARSSSEAELPAIFRARDLERHGIPAHAIQTMVRRAEVERIGRGLYRRLDTDISEHETMLAVCSKAPTAIVCLLSALSYWDIGTQLPWQVWIALPNKARIPDFGDLPVRVFRFSGPMLRYGVLAKEIDGVPVKITAPARTVVDCFRLRKKVGVDVAVESLRDAIDRRVATVDEIIRAAEFCNAKRAIMPYLEAILQ